MLCRPTRTTHRACGRATGACGRRAAAWPPGALGRELASAAPGGHDAARQGPLRRARVTGEIAGAIRGCARHRRAHEADHRDRRRRPASRPRLRLSGRDAQPRGVHRSHAHRVAVLGSRPRRRLGRARTDENRRQDRLDRDRDRLERAADRDRRAQRRRRRAPPRERDVHARGAARRLDARVVHLRLVGRRRCPSGCSRRSCGR